MTLPGIHDKNNKRAIGIPSIPKTAKRSGRLVKSSSSAERAAKAESKREVVSTEPKANGMGKEGAAIGEPQRFNDE